MPTRAQVTELLDRGYDHSAAARALGIPAGLAFMVATGTPADDPEAPAGMQALANPPAFNPTRKEHVLAWVRERATRELSRPR